MDEILNRLSQLILTEMERNNQSCVQFSELCGVGRNIVGDIINGKKKDVKLSTIMSICENSNICLSDIFSDTGRDKITDNNLFLLSGVTKYKVELKKL